MIIISLLSLLVVVACQVQHEQSTCVKLESVYESVCPNQLDRVTRQGVPGKRGVTGLKGERGERGSKGEKGNDAEPNYDRLGEIISQRLQEVADEQSRLSLALINATERIRKLESGIDNYGDAHCHLRYNGRCFWIELRYGLGINFDDARKLCASRGGNPGNIHSEEHFNTVIRYLRTFTNSSYSSIYVWTGLSHRKTNRLTYLFDAVTEAPYLKWYPGYPRTDRYCCRVALMASFNSQDSSQNMYTSDGVGMKKGILCEL